MEFQRIEIYFTTRCQSCIVIEITGLLGSTHTTWSYDIFVELLDLVNLTDFRPSSYSKSQPITLQCSSRVRLENNICDGVIWIGVLQSITFTLNVRHASNTSEITEINTI